MIKQYWPHMIFMVFVVMCLHSCSGNSLNQSERCKMPKHLFDDDCNYRNTRSLK